MQMSETTQKIEAFPVWISTNRRWHQVLWKGKHVLLCLQHPSHCKWGIPGKSQNECWILYDGKSNRIYQVSFVRLKNHNDLPNHGVDHKISEVIQFSFSLYCSVAIINKKGHVCQTKKQHSYNNEFLYWPI